MRKLAAIVLLTGLAALGTGLLQHLHYLGHANEDAAAAAVARAHGLPDPAPAHHDDSNCDLHAQLHLPLVSIGWVPLLICLGLFIAFLTEIAPRCALRGPSQRLDCRGPPAC
jgi:hypothetical protein